MDRIEPTEAAGSQTQSTETSAPTRPPLATLQPRRGSTRSRRPSIRISRLSSISSLDAANAQQPPQPDNQPGPCQQPALSQISTINSPLSEEDESWQAGRRRSNSEPRPGRWSSPSGDVLSRVTTRMTPLTEEASRQSPFSPTPLALDIQQNTPDQLGPLPSEAAPGQTKGVIRRTSLAALNRFGRNRATTVTGAAPTLTEQADPRANEYGSHVVDVLDVIDPEVSALSTLTNVQNSLFVPNLGGFINRMPTYTLTRSPPSEEEPEATADEGDVSEESKLQERPTLDQLRPFTSMSSVVTGPRYAVLPEGHMLEGWTREDFMELNDHVRHMLHSRRSKFKRSMKGFGQYVRKPLGFLVTLYATLITLFGLAWVLFLIGWINIGGKQLYVINVIDNILVALFAIMGDGLAPFRAVDTYHMIYIAHYTFLTWKIRRKRRMPDLKDKNDLPQRRKEEVIAEKDVDVELGDTSNGDDNDEFSVLKPDQQKRLMHHQKKFARSHTFYKPHETFTHHAFPLRILIAIVVLLDCHSLLQMALGACTWSMESPGKRPFALTTVILCCSITCNISGGVLILIGDRRTRKKDIVERLFRQQLTEEAMKKMQKRKVKEEEERRSMQINRPESSTAE